MIDLKLLKDKWVDTEAFHKEVCDYFTAQVNETPMLKEHRDWTTSNAFGFGEKAFHWFWKLLVDEMPSEFKFCEVGVFRGQVLTLIKILAGSTGRKVDRFGVTPLDGSDNHWVSDYRADIEKFHDTFHIPKDYTIYHGSSTDPKIIHQAKETAPYDLLYIDGSHQFLDVVSDLNHYTPLVKRGGYLLIDDACNDMKQPWGYFQGIEDVTRATLAYMAVHGNEWEFIGNVVHLRGYQRK